MKFVEQRSCERSTSVQPALAMGDRLVGLIRDISPCGCSFHYVRDRELSPDEPGDDRFLIIEPLGMNRVRVQTVLDVVTGSPMEHGRTELRLRRVRFVALSRRQREQLEKFLRIPQREQVAADDCQGVDGREISA